MYFTVHALAPRRSVQHSQAPFGKKLPPEYFELQGLHDRVRNGVFGELLLNDAYAEYLKALGNTPDTPFSEALSVLMKERVAVNRILKYLGIEFFNYPTLMESRFREFAELCPDFSDPAESAKIRERLAKGGVSEIEFELLHDGKNQTVSIADLEKTSLSFRYEKFWDVVREMFQHRNEDGCDLTITEVRFHS